MCGGGGSECRKWHLDFQKFSGGGGHAPGSPLTNSLAALGRAPRIITLQSIFETWQACTHLIMSGYQSQQITSQTLIRRKIKQTVSFINIVLSSGQNYICVEYKMTNNGPMMVPHGLKFQYRTHIGPIWAVCPESAHMGPI